MFNYIKITLLLATIISLFSTLVYSAQCPIKNSGCYTKNDVHSNAGDLAPGDFGYYLTDNQCIKGGKCDCGTNSPNVPKITEPDQLSDACNCIFGTDWNSNGKCCGDDADDCSRLTSTGVLCSVDAEGTGTWLTSSQPNVGDIKYVECSGSEYLSDGRTWTKCEGTFWKKTATNSEYLCIGNGRESIFECCGNGICNSREDGKRLETGQSVTFSSVQGAQTQLITGNAIITSITDITGATVLDASDPNLVVYWKFDEASGTTASDSSGHGNDGTLVNSPTWTSGKIGNGINFADAQNNEENNDYVIKNPISNFPTNEITTAFWIKTTDPTAELFSYASRRSDNDWDIRYDGSRDDPSIKIDRDGDRISTGKTVNDGNWHFIAITWRGSDGATNLYKDGSLVYGSTLAAGTSITSGGSLVIGQEQQGVGGNFDPSRDYSGMIDEFRIYNRVLNADEIKLLYENKIKTQPLIITTNSIPLATIGNAYSATISASGGNGSYSWALRSGNLSPGLTLRNGVCADTQGPCQAPAEIIGTPTSTGTYNFVVSLTDGSNTTSKQFILIVTKFTTVTYYCTPDNKFVSDLDVPNSQINNLILINRNKATCEAAGLTWTGTKCCSEADDVNEYYNDPNGTGGCWNDKPAISVDFVEGTGNSVINYNGEFHGCAIDKSIFNANNNNLSRVADQYTGNALITNHDYCFNNPESSFYCSYTEKWLPTDGADRTHLSFAPIRNVTQAAECCSPEQCWNGTRCIANQIANPSSLPMAGGFRCIDGEWTQSEIRNCPDGRPCGFCPRANQCVSDLSGQLQCVEPSHYIDDNFCENGNWTTRTKLLALKLLNLKNGISEGDYTLFCDNKDNTLNKLQYSTGPNEIANTVLANLKTNNFCVLKTRNSIVIGASLNRNLEEASRSSLNIFGVTTCNNAFIDDNQYHSCDATNKVWYNKRLKSIIYSPTLITISLDQDSTFIAEFTEFIQSPLQNIIDAIKRLIEIPPFDESYVKGLKKFDKLYMIEQGGKSIIGSIEGKNFKNMIIRYSGFETDLCNFIESYNAVKKDLSSGISCKKEGTNYYVLAQGSQFTNTNPDTIWSDLTSKLRLK